MSDDLQVLMFDIEGHVDMEPSQPVPGGQPPPAAISTGR
jgi:hypothetical protein